VDAAAAQRGGGLGAVLRRYRHAGALTQQQLADMLGYDRTYISMIESGRRNVTDRGTLAHIARALAIPPYMLGIAGPDDADFAAMLAFGTSVIRLAATARKAGRAAEAVSELWPLVNRLEARAAAGYAEPETMRLLCLARMSLGVALGHVLPDERLATAARWTGRALRIAWQLGDRPLLGMVLRMHGNELRKAGHPAAGTTRLRQALQVDDDPARQGAGLLLLARAAAESGQADLFDAATSRCARALETASQQDVLFNPFTLREVRLRGLLAMRRTAQAVDLAARYPADGGPPSPYWRVIERITTAEVLARAGDEEAAGTMLAAAISDAETLRLPHQIQRIIRLAEQPGALAGRMTGQQARSTFTRLDRQLAASPVQGGSRIAHPQPSALTCAGSSRSQGRGTTDFCEPQRLRPRPASEPDCAHSGRRLLHPGPRSADATSSRIRTIEHWAPRDSRASRSG
jgi:transcriptional regulator with XRE-family HTH domain